MAGSRKAPFRFWSFFFSLQGRVSRWPYVAFEATTRLSLLVGFQLIRHVYGLQLMVMPVLTLSFSLLSLIVLWPNFALCFKRLHDANLSGLWALPYFVPYIYGMAAGVLVVLSMRSHDTHALRQIAPVWIGWGITGIIWAVAIVPALLPGTKGANRFGPPPGRLAAVAEDIF